ncbi:PIR Superfamily Protein [Plasmodium ovale curtisi]|uniref:PIR Superfamily Protein n=2 Tax=Plasmodium ovale curtisi TaxID=864141 RepID=A0A1A8WBF8_PLAOA|nr:PIR Superfamily Protein [Plasmodium ovale curtisi]
MPKDNENADLDTLNKNKDLKKYYDKIECIYNGNSKCLSGQEGEVTEYEYTEATEDDQGSESDIFSNNDQVYNDFLSKFYDTLIKFLSQYDYSSLLLYDHSKQCVYFKYWFYDKILKNISSDKNLNVFYNDMQSGDEDDEDGNVDGDQKLFKENEIDELVVEYLDREDEEEEDIVEGSLLTEEEDDSYESENVEVVKNQHKHRDKNYGGNNILLSLNNSKNCNIYKLKFNQIIHIKLLYDYFENYDDKTKRTNVEKKIIEKRYCDSFNNLIELYNKNIECKSDESNNEYCPELEECRKNYPHTNIPKLICTVAESASGPQKQDANINHFQLGPQLPLRGRGTGNSPSGDIPHAVSENPEGVANIASTAQHTPYDMSEKHSLETQEHITASGHPNTQIASTDMTGSHSMDSEASTSCHYGSVGRSCESSLQPLAPMSTETENHLKQIPPQNSAVHTEPDVSLQEETGSTNTIVSSASSVLGVSALLFMLYRFTPLGSLINNRRGGMDTWDINEEGYDENLLFSSALGNTNSNNNNYSIGYYSLGNT